MIKDKFHGDARHGGGIEQPADNDGVMRRIVVAERSTRDAKAPSEFRPRHQSVEVAEVQFVEDLREVVDFAFGRRDLFASSRHANLLNFSADVFAGQVAPVEVEMIFGDWPAVELGKKDECEGLEYSRGRRRKYIRHSHINALVFQLNERIGVGETAEAYLERRWTRAGT